MTMLVRSSISTIQLSTGQSNDKDCNDNLFGLHLKIECSMPYTAKHVTKIKGIDIPLSYTGERPDHQTSDDRGPFTRETQK